jgi:hypothetical protein
LDNETAPQVPSIETVIRAVIYLGIAIALGYGFTNTLELMNSVFVAGVVLSLVDLALFLLLARYIVVKHFINPGS